VKKREVDLLADQWDSEHMVTDPAVLEKVVRYEKDASRSKATITFDNPGKLNALPVAALERIGDLVKQAETDDDVKVVVFRGEGPCFGVGADASELGHYVGYRAGETAADRKRPSQRQRVLPDRNVVFGAFERTITECLKATVCEVHGYCYGAHMQLALAADIVVASDDAKFTHPAFRYLGPAPQNLYLWIENLGLKKAKELMLTMRPLSAAEGEKAGLVTKVVARAELTQWVADYVEAIALMPLDALVMGKAMLLMIMEARGKGVGSSIGWVGHGWSTNLVFQPDEWNFVKERRDKGLGEALRDRDARTAPYFRLGGDDAAEESDAGPEL
jgi:enoyl-CoA hydratase